MVAVPSNGQLRCCTRLLLVVSVVGLAALLFELLVGWRHVAYLTRPLWDSPGAPWTIIPHYDHPLLPPAALCALHGWTARSSSDSPRVWDAFPYLLEADLLEIRLRELWPVVDHFVVAEAEHTFTGLPKPLRLPPLLNSSRFRWAASKLAYVTVAMQPLGQTQPADRAGHAWRNEALMRSSIAEHIHRSGARRGDLVLQTDADEIPSARTVALLRACEGYQTPLHLNLASYQYSFAWSVPVPADGVQSWRASVVHFDPDRLSYRHSRQSDWLLDAAGWHCSFCFRYLSDFRTKVTGYSHWDRLTTAAQLDSQRLQRNLCAGRDLFDMYHEVFAWRDVWLLWTGLLAQTAFTQLPRHLLDNPATFAFLLPGGCQRELSPPALTEQTTQQAAARDSR